MHEMLRQLHASCCWIILGGGGGFFFQYQFPFESYSCINSIPEKNKSPFSLVEVAFVRHTPSCLLKKRRRSFTCSGYTCLCYTSLSVSVSVSLSLSLSLPLPLSHTHTHTLVRTHLHQKSPFRFGRGNMTVIFSSLLALLRGEAGTESQF